LQFYIKEIVFKKKKKKTLIQQSQWCISQFSLYSQQCLLLDDEQF